MNKNELRVLTQLCSSGTCPTVYEAPNGDIVVQGDLHPLETPAHEGAVRIPREIFLQGAERMRFKEHL
jgi:hypothetical protein